MSQRTASHSTCRLFSIILLLSLLVSNLGFNVVLSAQAQAPGTEIAVVSSTSTSTEPPNKIIEFSDDVQTASGDALTANGKRVGIQAGHWQKDSGSTCTNGTREVDINLAVANKAAELLRGRGYTVDVLPGLATAVHYYSADVFIALHLDQCAAYYSGYKISRWKGQAGVGTNGSGDASDQWVNALWSAYGDSTGLPKDTSVGHYTPCFREYYALNPVNGGPICGGQYTQIHGISDSTPGAIIEMGWLSGDYNFVTSTDGQQKMATGIANGVDQFLGVVDPLNPPTLLSPSAGQTLNSRSIHFTWQSPNAINQNGYTFRLSTNSNPDTQPWTFDQGLGNEYSSYDYNFSSDGTFYWHMRTWNTSNQASNWVTRSFTINTSTTCPQSGGVILYWNANYNCSNNTGDSGYRQRTGIGWQNVIDGQFNDKASSVKVPSGWSVRLFEHADRGGGSVCYGSSISDFGTQGNFPGTSTPINDQVSSMEAFQNSNCSSGLPPSAPVPSSPANGQSFNEGESINLSWSSTGNEYYGEISGGPGGTLTFGWQTGTSKNIGSQWAGYVYTWRIKARNSYGESGWSFSPIFIVRPGAPTNLSASAVSCSQVNLSWSDNSGNEEGYKVYRNGNLIATLGSGATSYQNTGLAGSTNYSYVVKAYRGSIESNPSNTASTTTSACQTIPNTPSNFRVSSSTQTSITIAWDDVSNETGYKIYEWNGTSFVYLASVGANVTSYTETRDSCGWDEYYEVSAYNGSGESAHTTWIYGATQPCPLPGKVTLVAPSGDINSAQPMYVWNADNAATWYHLYVEDASGNNVIEEWYSAVDAGCDTGSGACSVTPATALQGGAYTWWVQTWNEAGYGLRSDSMDFSTPIPHAPGQAILIAPHGSLDTNNPSYTWDKVSDAEWYYLYISGPSDYVFTKWYWSGNVCDASSCSVSDVTNLGSGAHTWWVLTWNSSGGYGPWSDGLDFSITVPTLPGKASLTSPSGNIGTNNPTYSWINVSGATWYYLVISGPSNYVFAHWYPGPDLCDASACSIANVTPNLASGAYTWWIRTWNSAGYGPWSSGLSFDVTSPSLPGAATLVSPNSFTSDTTPTYTWNAVAGATYYYLWVNGPAGNRIRTWYTAAAVGCPSGTGTCSITPATILGSGAHTWWIRTWSSAGTGPWSSAMNFSLP